MIHGSCTREIFRLMLQSQVARCLANSALATPVISIYIIVVRTTPRLSEAWRDLTLSQNFRSCLPRMNCGQPTPMDFPLSVAPKCFHCSRIVLTIFLLKTFRLCSFRPNKIIQPCPNSKNPPIVNHSKSQRHFPTSASMGRERFSASQTKWRQFRKLLDAKESQNNQHVNENESQVVVVVHTK